MSGRVRVRVSGCQVGLGFGVNKQIFLKKCQDFLTEGSKVVFLSALLRAQKPNKKKKNLKNRKKKKN